MKIKEILFLMTLCLADTASATCRDVRLDQNGGPFEKIPVYDQMRSTQVDTGICYAIAASAILDADRFYKGDSLNRLTSPVSVAAITKIGSQYRAPNPGDQSLGSDGIFSALTAVKNSTLCDQRYFERFASLVGSINKRPLPSSSLQSETVSSTANFLNSLSAQRQNALPRNPYIEMRVGSQGDLVKIRQLLLSSLNEKDFEAQIAKTMAGLCEEHTIQTEEISAQNFVGFTPEEDARGRELQAAIRVELNIAKSTQMQRELIHMMDKRVIPRDQRMINKVISIMDQAKPVPVGIHYDSSLVGGQKGARHAGVIIGQRPGLQGSCEFLIRDSFGPHCGERKYPTTRPCENGNIWVPSDKLKESLGSITWIER